MVFEALINPKNVQRLSSWKIFLLGFLYSSVAILLSFWIFKGYVSIVMVSLTVVASIVLVHNLILFEEDIEKKTKKELALMKKHARLIEVFSLLFLGFTISFALWYIFLPAVTAQNAFNVQIETIKATTIMPSGNFVNASNTLGIIFENNLKILFFCIIFSFFYGAGAIFILTWNASVMGTAIGSFIRGNLASTSGISYFQIAGIGVMRYLLHGLPEIVAYFIGALAGGIISVALIKHDFNTKSFKHIMLDSFYLIVLAVGILFFAALIETFITPAIF